MLVVNFLYLFINAIIKTTITTLL